MAERTVEIGSVDEGRATRAVGEMSSGEGPSLTSVMDAVPKFTRVDDFTTFSAEYTLQNGDIVIHFFPTNDRVSTAYWTKRFPAVLDRVAQVYFEATSPRLQAKYTEELSSWWFRARSYSHVIDFRGLVWGFLEELDRELEVMP